MARVMYSFGKHFNLVQNSYESILTLGRTGGEGRGIDATTSSPSQRLFQNFEKSSYYEILKRSVAVHLSTADSLHHLTLPWQPLNDRIC